MAQRGDDMSGTVLRAGPIEAEVVRETNHPAIEVRVGDFRLYIQATPRGRRVFVSIDDGSVDVQVARRHRDDRWG
jgi:hypothetical protein